MTALIAKLRNVAAAMLLLLAEFFLPERKRSKTRSLKAKAVAPAAVAVAVLLQIPMSMDASPASALQQYHSGQFTNALAEYTKIAAVKTNDLRLIFNAGDAAYRATNFDLAQSLFQQVTVSPDLKLQAQAFYNLGNVQFQKAKHGADRGSLEREATGQVFDCATESLQIILKRDRLFEDIQVLTLQIFFERNFADLLIGEAENSARNLAEPSFLGRDQPPLTGDQLVAVTGGANEKWLQDAVDSNAVDQFINRRLIKILPRLKRISLDQFDGNFCLTGSIRLIGTADRSGSHQSVQATSKSSSRRFWNGMYLIKLLVHDSFLGETHLRRAILGGVK